MRELLQLISKPKSAYIHHSNLVQCAVHVYAVGTLGNTLCAEMLEFVLKHSAGSEEGATCAVGSGCQAPHAVVYVASYVVSSFVL